jgi:hypothetical protein
MRISVTIVTAVNVVNCRDYVTVVKRPERTALTGQ